MLLKGSNFWMTLTREKHGTVHWWQAALTRKDSAHGRGMDDQHPEVIPEPTMSFPELSRSFVIHTPGLETLPERSGSRMEAVGRCCQRQSDA